MRRFIWFLGLITVLSSQGFNKELETVLMKDYNRKHRPVKKEASTVQVQVYLTITHVENVNEHEQTMLVHGTLWAGWKDEYLVWDPKQWNGTTLLNIESYKVWQPALSLYNSAKANSWYLYMHGLPATVNSNGRIWASGAFSFHVTCLFDFTNWPYDEQECPIVLADWVYDLAKVNLSDPYGDNPWTKPQIRLNFDPSNKDEKRHVAGWEVFDSWRRHCYWGPSGCKNELPEGNPEWYWSLLEFGVKLRRHAPYFVLTVVLPTLLSSLLTLASFWIETPSMAVGLNVFNILLQGLFGWDLVRELPPGSGGVPKIVSLYGLNLSLTTIAFVLHCFLQYFEFILPKEYTIPLPKIGDSLTKLQQFQFFKSKGLSFDPQLLLQSEPFDESYNYDQPLPKVSSGITLGSGSALSNEDPQIISIGSSDQLVDLGGIGHQHNHENHHQQQIQGDGEQADEPKRLSSESVAVDTSSPLAQQLFLIRRVIFCLMAIIYGISFPICTINWF